MTLAFVLWTTPAVARALLGTEDPLAQALRRHLPEAGVALLCATPLFAPVASAVDPPTGRSGQSSAPERVLEMLAEGQDAERLLATAREMAEYGYRVLAVAGEGPPAAALVVVAEFMEVTPRAVDEQLVERLEQDGQQSLLRRRAHRASGSAMRRVTSPPLGVSGNPVHRVRGC